MPILYVDDNDSRTVVRETWLRAAGYRVVVATNGQDAKRLVEYERPRVALIDVHLPDMSGIELSLWLKTRNPRLPVILFSALFTTPHNQAEGFIDGVADRYVVEPVAREMFLSALHALTQRGNGPME